MKVQLFDVEKLIPYENNPRKNDKAVNAVANSIKAFGFKQPIVVDRNMVVVAGHTRLKAAKQLKLKEVPVVIADDLTDEEVKAYRLADNRVSEAATWDDDLLKIELDGIVDIDMSDFGFDLDLDDDEEEDFRDPSCQHNVFENQERMQFPADNYYGIPTMTATKTTGDKFLRFMDYNLLKDHSDHIAHFYYDDYKFIEAWRNPDKYIDKLKQFKAVISPDFSLYTDFPRALQILSCYRRQWCGAY